MFPLCYHWPFLQIHLRKLAYCLIPVKNSHLLKHAREKGHTHVWENDFKILGNNYQSNIKRKISEFLFIRQLKPTLNANEKSIPLHLFN